MDKVFVEIFLPTANESYDVHIPLTSKMSEVSLLVTKVITELSEGRCKSPVDSVLCDRDSGTVLDVNRSVAELGIQNGSRLMLI